MVECLPGYEWSLDQTFQTFDCIEDGWNVTDLHHCLLGKIQFASTTNYIIVIIYIYIYIS